MQRRFFVVTRVGVYADEIRQRFFLPPHHHTLTEAQQKAADVSGDGNITVADAQIICQYILHNITEFPVEKNS